jgi:hypothetical protein
LTVLMVTDVPLCCVWCRVQRTAGVLVHCVLATPNPPNATRRHHHHAARRRVAAAAHQEPSLHLSTRLWPLEAAARQEPKL